MLLKFERDDGTFGSLRGDQKMARGCYLSDIKPTVAVLVQVVKKLILNSLRRMRLPKWQAARKERLPNWGPREKKKYSNHWQRTGRTNSALSRLASIRMLSWRTHDLTEQSK